MKPTRSALAQALDHVEQDQLDQAEREADEAEAEALGEGWPPLDPRLLTDGRRRAVPLPLDPFGPAGPWIAASAEGRAAPPDYVAAGLLAVASALIGTARAVSPWEGWTEPPILWLGIVGDPGAGKSPSLRPVLDTAHALEAEWSPDYAEALAGHERDRLAARFARERWETLVKEAVEGGSTPPPPPADATPREEPQRPRLVLSDATIEALVKAHVGNPRGLLIYRDELAGLLGAFGRNGSEAADRSLYLEGWSGARYIVDRVKHGGRPLVVERLSLSLLGGIQPERLASLLLAGDDDGLAQRFLWCWPDPRPRRVPTHAGDSSVVLAAFRRLRALVPADDGRPLVLALDPAARHRYAGWWQRREDHGRSLAGRAASAATKLDGYALRLSLVLQLLGAAWTGGGRAPEAISDEAVTAGIRLVETYFEPMAERVYGDAALPQRDRDSVQLARWLGREGRTLVNLRAARQAGAIPGCRETQRYRSAAEELVEGGALRPVGGRAGTTAGRQRQDYEVSPALLARRGQ